MSNIKASTTFLLSIVSSLTIILLQIFRWNLVDMFTPFLEPNIEYYFPKRDMFTRLDY